MDQLYKYLENTETCNKINTEWWLNQKYTGGRGRYTTALLEAVGGGRHSCGKGRRRHEKNLKKKNGFMD